MAGTYYQLNIVPSNPDQIFSTGLNGLYFNARLYFSTTTKLWWLELSTSDNTVTVSHICLRPGILHRLSGKIPGYSGEGAIGAVRLRVRDAFDTVDAFNGSFGLFMYDDVED